MKLLHDFEIMQFAAAGASYVAVNAVDFAGHLAQLAGADVFVAGDYPGDPDGANRADKTVVREQTGLAGAIAWAAEKPRRVLLIANTEEPEEKLRDAGVAAVEVNLESWQSESTVFAMCGLAHLLGDPAREPLVPAGYYAAGPIGYAVFCALAGLYLSISRFGAPDVARLDGVSALGWVNWKAAAGGVVGSEMCREGDASAWPMLPCRDGYAALVYNEKDWTSIQKMLGDDRLEDERLDSLQKRMVHQELWLPIVRDWAASRTKAELNALFLEYAVPAAAVATPRDLLQDPLLQHRKAFHPRNKSDGTTVMAMREPHRIIHRMPATTAPQVRASIDAPGVAAGQLPLSGIRVLDLGIITAGAGTGGLIADMGAEVLKIESATYPDPFRFWAGSDDSPLFKFNNRNKYGVGLDLKTDEGKARFFELVKSADVVVENFRRGVIERMGFGLEALRQHNPRIVLASISGQGADGPGAHHATYGSTLEANSGFAALTCYEEGRPYITGYNVNYPDQTVCLYGAAAIALAVQSARDQNCSLHIDISQRDTAAFIIGDVIERVSAGMSDLPDVVRGATSPNAFEGVFKSSDGVYLAVSVTDWQQVSDSPELDGVTTREALAAWVEARSHEIAESDLLAAGCGAARCMDGKGMYELERTQATETFQHTQSGALVKGFPFQFLGNPMKVWCEAPAIGQHNDRFVDSL